jgi:FkbM family methyltransferase
MAKTFVQNMLRPFGIQLSRVMTPERQEALEEAQKLSRLRWVKPLGIKTVLDIGANTGQFAGFVHKLLPEAQIFAFEPLQDCFNALEAKFKGNRHFQGFNLALGDQVGEVEVFRNEFSPSSSLLPMNDVHKENFPYTEKARVEKIKISKLDDLAPNLAIQEPLLVKLDVQGFEDRVLRGGHKTIQRATVIITELSAENLYQDQPLFEEIYRMLIEMGFRYHGNFDQLLSPIDGRVLQMDGVFLNTKMMPLNSQVSTSEKSLLS